MPLRRQQATDCLYRRLDRLEGRLADADRGLVSLRTQVDSLILDKKRDWLLWVTLLAVLADFAMSRL